MSAQQLLAALAEIKCVRTPDAEARRSSSAM